MDLAAGTSALVRVDQVGYRSAETKYGVVVSGAATGAFNLRRSTDDASVLAGTLAAAFTDTASGDSVRTADFSGWTTPGSYYLDVAGVGRSFNFQIGDDVYGNAYYLALRSFYGQRCGTAVDLGTVDGTAYAYPICHASGAATDLGSTFHASSGRTGTRNTGKGWHDAGDYGKYIVNSGITTGQILWTYEWWSDRIGSLDLDIPESGNSTPDILDEARWNLEWMLTMQDTDGGVWHKNTSAGFGGMTLPHLDNAGTRYIIGDGTGAPYKTSCSTADFAAVMAIAARLFQPYDAAFAANCLTAAQNAWTWVTANPNATYDQPGGISTGGYGDGNCSDERLWAAAELFRTTGNAAYNNFVTTNTPAGTLFSGTAYPQDWAGVRNMALWTYYFSGQASANAALRTRILNDTVAAATVIATRTNGGTNGYKVSLVPPGHYVWGSNGGVANFGVFLLVADRMAPSANYTNAALNNLHYLLGRNTNNVSYVTHVGSNPFQRPHHRPSASPEFAAGPPWPGLLSGGPSNGSDPAIDASPQDGGPIAKRWIDDTDSYATNENAINWNAPLVFLLAWTVPPPNANTPTFTPSRTATPTPTSTWTRTGTPSPTPTRTRTGTPTATRTPTPTASISPTSTPTRTASFSSTPSATPSRTATSIPSPTGTATGTATPSVTGTATPSASSTRSSTPTATASPTRTATPTASPTRSPTATASPSFTPSPIASDTVSPTVTLSFTDSPTPSASPSSSPTRTASTSATPSPTSTLGVNSPTWTPTASSTVTGTATPSATPSFTPSPIASDTVSPTQTPSFTASPVASDTVSPTSSPSSTVTPTRTLTSTTTASPTATQSRTATPTATVSRTATPSFSPSPVATPTVTPLVPNIAAVNPVSAAGTGGWVMTVDGSNFEPGAEIVINGTPYSATYVSPTQLQLSSAPALPSGTLPVSVRNPGNVNSNNSADVVISGPAPTATPDSGPLHVLDARFHPHPAHGPDLYLRFKLDGPAESVSLKIYSRAFVLMASLSNAGQYQSGWNQASFSAPDLPAGTWFCVVHAQAGGRESLKSAPVRLFKAR